VSECEVEAICFFTFHRFELHLSRQVRVLEEAVASLESILGDEAYEEDDDEGDGENGAKV